MARVALVGEYVAALEADIQYAEAALGIDTRPARLVEAACAIDLDFLHTAIITGQPERPERIFGDAEWLAHLEARLFAKEYGVQPLTTDFVLAVYQRFLGRLAPGRANEIRDGHGGYGGDYVDGTFAPARFSDEQIEAINGNRFIRYLPDNVAGSNMGYIEYATMSATERRLCLDKICNEYNAQRVQPGVDHYGVNAQMKRQIVDLHPFCYDFTGRTTKVLMDWGLENAGLPPSAVKDPDGDLLVPPDTWTREVRAGSERYAAYTDRVDSGETDLVLLFGLEREAERYSLLGARGYEPPLLTPGEWHDRGLYRAFTSSLRLRR